jgi:hypothetical protein
LLKTTYDKKIEVKRETEEIFQNKMWLGKAIGGKIETKNIFNAKI